MYRKSSVPTLMIEICLAGRILFLICMPYVLIARIAEWEQYILNGLGHVSWVGHVLCMQILLNIYLVTSTHRQANARPWRRFFERGFSSNVGKWWESERSCRDASIDESLGVLFVLSHPLSRE